MTLTSRMPSKPLSKRPPVAQKIVLRDATVRNFDGGWDVIDSDLNLSTKYAKQLTNLLRGADGTLSLRYGTYWLHEFADVGLSDIVASFYFHTYLLVVDDQGRVGAGQADGTVIKIWDSTIARSLSGNPRGWSPCQFASGAEFDGTFTIHNGIDKPIVVASNLLVRYLADLGTGSNAFTPIGRFVKTHDRYTVVAGDPLDPSVLHISAQDTNATFVGDPAPNDAVDYDMSPHVTLGSSEIRGLGAFRDKLVVVFDQCIALVTLGNYSSDTTPVHQPDVDDVIENYGSIGHNVIQNLGSDMLFMDLVGVPSIQRALLTNNISPVRESQLIDPAIQAALGKLTAASLQDRCFAVHDKLSYTTMFFVPNSDDLSTTTETLCFAYRNIREQKVRAWSPLRGWNWRCGTATAEGRVIFCQGTKSFAYGNEQSSEQYPADLIGYAETFSDGEVFTDGTGWTPIATETADGDDLSPTVSGLPIMFDWQMPWQDLQTRTKSKRSHYIKVESSGRGAFTVEMFVDNILQAQLDVGEAFVDGTLFTDGYGWFPSDTTYDPQLTMDFVGGSRLGFGGEQFQDYFGGGRISSDERLYAWPCKFNVFKLRVQGRTRGPLKFTSVSLYYQLLNIKR